MPDSLITQATILALVQATKKEWYRTAALLADAGSVDRILGSGWTGLEGFDTELADQLSAKVTAGAIDAAREEISELATKGVSVVTVLDETYPANLRLIYNLPPLLFVRGALTAADDRAIAIVGTRQASDAGLAQARQLATELAHNDVTVLSGLALGIDTAAHAAALDAGGRTVAVLGHGILAPLYPRDNRALADRITTQGALISQFLPESRPTRGTFPARNIITSGMSVGTVVIEASDTSGAKLQARLALEHGKRVFFVESLVMQQKWARMYVDKRGATVIKSVDDILATMMQLAGPAQQLTLA